VVFVVLLLLLLLFVVFVRTCYSLLSLHTKSLQQKASINCIDVEKATPLHKASFNGNVEAVSDPPLHPLLEVSLNFLAGEGTAG
jgi:hypothetical protein